MPAGCAGNEVEVTVSRRRFPDWLCDMMRELEGKDAMSVRAVQRGDWRLTFFFPAFNVCPGTFDLLHLGRPLSRGPRHVVPTRHAKTGRLNRV